MARKTSDLMQLDVVTVSPDASLAVLQRSLWE